jgi:hypothetical protein
MQEHIDRILKNYEFYTLACMINDREHQYARIKSVSGIDLENIPLGLYNILRALCMDKPNYYWDRDVSNEVENIIQQNIDADFDKFLTGFTNSSTEFFESIRSLESITNIIKDLREVAFEEGYKTKLIRCPLFSQIYEDLLMNLYRIIRNIINEYSDKDYSVQNTLGSIVPCLKKHGFDLSTEIDIDLRNAINHGNLFVHGDDIEYRFGKNSSYAYANIKYYEFDRLIDRSYDIASGILMGLIKTLTKYPEVILHHDNVSEDIAREWYRLTFSNSQNTILYLNNVQPEKTNQLNIHLQSKILDYNSLIVSLIELAKGAHIRFPDYDRYFVGFKHNRCPSGFIYLDKEELDKTDDLGELFKLIVANKSILAFPIRTEEINESAYKYHVFPKIESEHYTAQDIKDCSSLKDFKRIKADIILPKRYSKKNIRIIIQKIITQMKLIETPENPLIETKYGKEECDMIFLNIFINGYDRKKFNLFTNNSSFVCSAHYYKSTDCPRLKHGGVMENLWKEYKHEKCKNINIAWNPNYKTGA